MLTKRLLRRAAAHISSYEHANDDDDQTYMCHAVYIAAGGSTVDWAPRDCATVQAFERLLTAHGVDTNGTLTHGAVPRHASEETQALRFDFLNLLAESL